MTGRGFPVLALGQCWWVDTDALPDDVHERLVRLWSRAAPADGECGEAAPRATLTLVPADADSLSGEGHRVADSADRIPYGVSRALTLATLQRRRGELLLLHAAGLTPPGDSRAVVLVAESGTGKSTAAAHLARSWGYLSDESIGITDDHRVVGHPKPVSLLVDPREPDHKEEASPDDAGYARAPRATSLGAVVLLRRDPGRAEPASLDVVPVLDAVLAAIAQTSSLYLLDDPLDRLARALTVAGGPFHLDYRDIRDCEGLLGGLLDDAGSRTAQAWTHHPPGPDRRAALTETVDGGVEGEVRDGRPPRVVAAPTGATTLRRAPWTDAIATDDGVVVLAGDRPYLLGSVGHALWLALAEPRTLDELVADVVRALGDHPDARALTGGAAEQLADVGLVELAD